MADEGRQLPAQGPGPGEGGVGGGARSKQRGGRSKSRFRKTANSGQEQGVSRSEWINAVDMSQIPLRELYVQYLTKLKDSPSTNSDFPKFKQGFFCLRRGLRTHQFY